MAQAIEFKGVNKRFLPPEGVSEEQCRTLHAFVNGANIVTCWKLTEDELREINRTGCVWSAIWSGKLPPQFIGSESTAHSVVADFGAVWKLSPQHKPVVYTYAFDGEIYCVRRSGPVIATFKYAEDAREYCDMMNDKIARKPKP